MSDLILIRRGGMIMKHRLDAVADALGIPVETLRGLRDGSRVALLPDEIAAREAAAAEAMLGKAVERLYEIAGRHDANGAKRDAAVVRGAARLVASLPIPAADALARMLERARAEEREACALIADRKAVFAAAGGPHKCSNINGALWFGRQQYAEEIAADIRARGKETKA